MFSPVIHMSALKYSIENQFLYIIELNTFKNQIHVLRKSWKYCSGDSSMCARHTVLEGGVPLCPVTHCIGVVIYHILSAALHPLLLFSLSLLAWLFLTWSHGRVHCAVPTLWYLTYRHLVSEILRNRIYSAQHSFLLLFPTLHPPDVTHCLWKELLCVGMCRHQIWTQSAKSSSRFLVPNMWPVASWAVPTSWSTGRA